MWFFIAALGFCSPAYYLYKNYGLGIWIDKKEIVCSRAETAHLDNEKLPLGYGPLLDGINRIVLVIRAPDGFATDRFYPSELRPNNLARSVGHAICMSDAVHDISLRQGGYVAPLMVLTRAPNDRETKVTGTLTFTININTKIGKVLVIVHRPDHPEFSDDRGPGLNVPFEERAEKEVVRFIKLSILGPPPQGEN